MPRTEKLLNLTLPGRPEDIEALMQGIEAAFEKIAAMHRLNRADVQRLEERMSAAEAVLADHEARISDLEP